MSPSRTTDRKSNPPSLGQAVFYPSSLPPPLRRPSKALPPYTSRPNSPVSPSPMVMSASGQSRRLSTPPPRKLTVAKTPSPGNANDSGQEITTTFERYGCALEFPFPSQGSMSQLNHSPTRKLTNLLDSLSFATPQHHSANYQSYNHLLYSAGSEPELDITTPNALPFSDLINEALIEEEAQSSPETENIKYSSAYLSSQKGFSFPRLPPPPLAAHIPKSNSFQLGSPPRQSFSPQMRSGDLQQSHSWNDFRMGERRSSPPQLNLRVNQPTYAPPSPFIGGAVSPLTAPSPLVDDGTPTSYFFPSQSQYDDLFSPSYQLEAPRSVAQYHQHLFTPPYTEEPLPLPAPSNTLQLHHSTLYPSAPLYRPSQVAPVPLQQATPSSELPQSEVAAHYLQNRSLCPAFSRRYVIRDELGSGGFGFVCSAIQTGYKNQPGIEVAVKFIFKDRITECEYAMIQGEPVESYVLSRIQHPSVIGFKELFEDDEFFYLVQELHGDPWAPGHTLEVPDTIQNPTIASHTPAPHPVPVIQTPQTPGSAFLFSPVHSVDWSKLSPFSGEPGKRPNMARRASYDLFECVEHQRFSEEQSRKIFRQIVDGVSYLHKKGIYHRDLKDENIVIDRNLCVKIIDFGSAVIEDRSFPPVLYDHFRGTMSYASAEVLNGRHYHAGPADIWSIGIILGIILTGESPFPNTTWAQEGRIKIKRQVPGGAFDLMQKCLCTDPRRRATIEQVERHPWLRGMLAHRGSIC